MQYLRPDSVHEYKFNKIGEWFISSGLNFESKVEKRIIFDLRDEPIPFVTMMLHYENVKHINELDLEKEYPKISECMADIIRALGKEFPPEYKKLGGYVETPTFLTHPTRNNDLFYHSSFIYIATEKISENDRTEDYIAPLNPNMKIASGTLNILA